VLPGSLILAYQGLEEENLYQKLPGPPGWGLMQQASPLLIGKKEIAKQSVFIKIYIKGKAVPLQAWSGPEVSRKLRFPGYMTTAQDGGKVASLTHRPPLPSGNAPGTHFC
jgi:hypothetical protein